jgi:23S rRNA (cytidine2498-2'-O)-methyltransferase
VSELDVYLTSPGYEAALAAELAGPAGPRWPAVVSVALDPDPTVRARTRTRTRDLTDASSSRPSTKGIPDPIWARQRIPHATQVRGESVRDLAEAAYAIVESAIDAAEAGFVLHAFVPDPDEYSHLAKRASLIGEGLMALLQERRRRASRRRVPDDEARARWADLLVVQLALVGRTSLLVSAARPASLPLGGFDLAPWPAGIAPVAEDRAAPSRAYGKLEESFAWMGVAPGPTDVCVDLGGAPGGWAWKALQRGARVVAVDRAPLAPPAAGHPALATLQGNAFTYQPASPADWLLCDVICEPLRTVELVDRWVGQGWCRAVVATLKFKGASGYGLLEAAILRLAAHGWGHVRLKHLFRHHNEVVIMLLR